MIALLSYYTYTVANKAPFINSVLSVGILLSIVCRLTLYVGAINFESRNKVENVPPEDTIVPWLAVYCLCDLGYYILL